MVALDADDDGVGTFVEVRGFDHLADQGAAFDDRIAFGNRVSVMDDQSELDLAAVRKIARTEPHQRGQRNQGKEFAKHGTLNSLHWAFISCLC